MVEPITAVGAGLAVLGSKDILNKVLGPTAEYLGAKTAGLVEKCDVNLDKIFARAYKKLGPRADTPGGVSARVLRHVVEDGRFVEDELVAEYYGGLLASSKTPTGSDDRGLPHLSRVKAMSVYQIRLHFLIYLSMLRLFHEEATNVGDNQERSKLKIFVPYPTVVAGLRPEPLASFHSIFTHAINGLYSDGLVHNFSYGDVDHLKKTFSGAPAPGLVVEPTFIGAEFFLWAIGREDPNGHAFLLQDLAAIEAPIVVERTAIRVIPKANESAKG
jgi:hypothetical protein